ncbi:threonine--tRNA ligase [Erythrobacter litoralis]|uniref:Threonine--tRNA ligase n=1 Tax=Erythrobacter litoralis (strain HTCC2594) TaxID=314225 RepID=SYT_ERYLH|nr:threonine--tRNA ligase [Erythrobacter litoralis]Q2N6X5.1 RecName: Full=Threonine--tRNA ligase; AltName: Full=Threonyl-tRNA synthetase; Short=ThrRS [Erythrobacter litoralis HTCC2594]ABC64566.1 threonyl-tRNA synthetase [Erythrobacter litoralis HTCC2594]
MTELLKISLPDGSVREMEAGATPADVAAAIGPGLAKAALAAKVDGEVRDLNRPFEGDAELALITSRDEEEALELARHDYAHVLAEAVQALWPGTQITFGPATDDGFYYDVKAPDSRDPFGMDDLPAIEEKMREIIKADKPLVREVWSREQLIEKWEAEGEVFKAEWAKELPEDEELTVYWSGEPGGEDSWLDMCRGPHLASTGKLDPQAFKLMRVAGAYWRGDQRNPQLTRIYGTGWLNKKQLNAHLHRLEEAAKRDHRKLGREMDLFHLQEEAHGSVFWHPQGYKIWRELEAYMRRKMDGAGYREIKTPQVMDARQWEQSGHWGKYRENMFVIPDEIPNTEDEGELVSKDADWMALKPMNCPAHVLVFKQGITSYRDLPIRLGEMGCCHRNEPHGALHGLMRVRQFTQDDAHIFCTEDQVVEEVRAFCKLADEVYRDFGFDYDVKLALRPEQRFGSEEDWDKAEQELRDAVAEAGMANDDYGWEELPGEGAFYAPKLEWHLTDAIGRTWQVGTIQGDRVLPERLDATYVGEDGGKHRPVMLHRAIFGSYERFIGILIEHFAGRLPVWLAPTQAVVATIVSDADGYAKEAVAKLEAAGIRVDGDLRNEKINFKVREHSLAKVPHLLVVGKREAEEGTVAVRTLGEKEQQVMSLDDAIAMLKDAATPPDLRDG